MRHFSCKCVSLGSHILFKISFRANHFLSVVIAVVDVLDRGSISQRYAGLANVIQTTQLGPNSLPPAKLSTDLAVDKLAPPKSPLVPLFNLLSH